MLVMVNRGAFTEEFGESLGGEGSFGRTKTKAFLVEAKDMVGIAIDDLQVVRD